jgi:hypothetical protein
MNAQRALALVLAIAATSACRAEPSEPSEPPWTPLFDGRSLRDWKVAPIGGAGPVEVVDGALRLGQGAPMTCVTYGGELDGLPFPHDDYELEVEAARRLGTDFFCAITFPVGDAALTLVLGGWGGSLCGLSCLDGEDAAHNSTKSFHTFERGHYYTVKLRVSGGRVRAWLDGEPLVDEETSGRSMTLRPEVECCRPLGLATYLTVGEVRAAEGRRISRPRR